MVDGNNEVDSMSLDEGSCTISDVIKDGLVDGCNCCSSGNDGCGGTTISTILLTGVTFLLSTATEDINEPLLSSLSSNC